MLLRVFSSQVVNMPKSGDSSVLQGNQCLKDFFFLTSWWNFPSCSLIGKCQLVFTGEGSMLDGDAMKDKLLCREVAFTFFSVLLV